MSVQNFYFIMEFLLLNFYTIDYYQIFSVPEFTEFCCRSLPENYECQSFGYRSNLRPTTGIVYLLAMRTFVAIPLPDVCRGMLNQMQQFLRFHKADVRWVSICSIHLTLKFLGEVDPALVPKLAESLQSEATALPHISLRLHGLGCFPNIRNPRVIWCGIEGETEKLSHIQQCIETTCAQFGFALEDRNFHPHLTLGRINSKRNLKPLMDCIKIGSDLESSFCADHFNIYRSDLKPQGAIYTIINTITLNK